MENVEKLVDQIIDGDNAAAKDTFGDILSVKITDALDRKKQDLSKNIFNEPQSEEE